MVISSYKIFHRTENGVLFPNLASLASVPSCF